MRGNGITKPPWESLEALQSLRELNLDQVFLNDLFFFQKFIISLKHFSVPEQYHHFEFTFTSFFQNNTFTFFFQNKIFTFLFQNNITSLRKKAFGRLPVVFHLGLSENQINNISVEVNISTVA